MDRIHITGGVPLNGIIPISGAKNAALPLMIASLLTGETLELINVPRLADIAALTRILGNHGVDHMVVGKRPGQTTETGQTIRLTASNVIDTTAPYELVSTMRASFWVIAPLLARFGEAKVSLPGGCAIGTRPVDLLIMALERLGAEIEIDAGYVVARTKNGLRGAGIDFPKVTVGGTHVALMAASLAYGTTVIENAAREPEVVDLAECLNKMGARVSGAGTPTITITGVSKLRGATHSVIPDRIETGAYAMAAAMSGGEVRLTNTRADILGGLVEKLNEAGAEVRPTNDGLEIKRNGARLRAVDLTTEVYPGFATDMQAPFMALMTTAEGESVVRETIFENRFMHAPELMRLGADIVVHGGEARVRGVDVLHGAQVMATDLRASVSLVIAGLAAEGETVVNRVYHLDRGFERLEEKLGACGAKVRRIKGSGEPEDG